MSLDYVAKVILQHGDGSTEELTDETGYFVCHWLNKEDGSIKYTCGGLELNEKFRMAVILLDAFTDTLDERMLSDTDQLILDQARATKAAEELLSP